MKVKDTVKKKLALRCGNRCAFQDCRKVLASESIIAEVAHICGANPGSARYQDGMTAEQRNHYDNLIYLCPNCHTKIDTQEKDYPAEYLRNLKQEHENWVTQQMDQGMSEFSFAELEIAAKAIASGQHTDSSDFQVIPPDEKIKKNSLSSSSRSYISMGLSKSAEVERFLARMAIADEGYPGRLKNGFKEKYLDLKPTYSGDDLFFTMLHFSQAGLKDFTLQAAGLAILSHLFHLCEVFEK